MFCQVAMFYVDVLNHRVQSFIYRKWQAKQLYLLPSPIPNPITITDESSYCAVCSISFKGVNIIYLKSPII